MEKTDNKDSGIEKQNRDDESSSKGDGLSIVETFLHFLYMFVR